VFPVIRWEFGHILFRHGKYQVQSNMQQDQEEESHNSHLVRSAVSLCHVSYMLLFIVLNPTYWWAFISIDFKQNFVKHIHLFVLKKTHPLVSSSYGLIRTMKAACRLRKNEEERSNEYIDDHVRP
jgi:hypothetical protein